jgi:type VI secretion system protein ImpB
MASIAPRVAFQVENKLAGDGSTTSTELKFQHIDDFEPQALVQQIPALKKLLEARQKLTDLLGKLDGNDELDRLLQDVVTNTEQLTEIKQLAAPAPTA